VPFAERKPNREPAARSSRFALQFAPRDVPLSAPASDNPYAAALLADLQLWTDPAAGQNSQINRPLAKQPPAAIFLLIDCLLIELPTRHIPPAFEV
jgi:hypothetical protein